MSGACGANSMAPRPKSSRRCCSSRRGFGATRPGARPRRRRAHRRRKRSSAERTSALVGATAGAPATFARHAADAEIGYDLDRDAAAGMREREEGGEGGTRRHHRRGRAAHSARSRPEASSLARAPPAHVGRKLRALPRPHAFPTAPFLRAMPRARVTPPDHLARRYALDVTIGGSPVRDSPFAVQVLPGPTSPSHCVAAMMGCLKSRRRRGSLRLLGDAEFTRSATPASSTSKMRSPSRLPASVPDSPASSGKNAPVTDLVLLAARTA